YGEVLAEGRLGRGQAERLGDLGERAALGEGIHRVDACEERILRLERTLDGDQDVPYDRAVAVARINTQQVPAVHRADRLTDLSDGSRERGLVELRALLAAPDHATTGVDGCRGG